MYLSIRHRLSLPVLAGILIVFVAIGLIYQHQVGQDMEAKANSILSYRARLVRTGLEAALETTRSLALSASENTTISAALANGLRDSLLDSTYPLLVNAGRKLGLTRFEFYIPPATSFLKVQSPADFGQDLSTIRPELKEVMTKNEARSGLARSGAALVTRALEPVVHEGKVVGAVEFGVLVDNELLKRYAGSKPAFNISILIEDGQDEFVFAARNHQLPILKSSLKALHQIMATGTSQTLDVVKGGGRKKVFIAPLKGLNGTNVALLAIPMDVTASDKALVHSLWILVALGAASFIIVIGLIYWSTGKLLSHLGRLTNTMSLVSQTHDLTQRVDLHLDQACWEEQNCGRDDCICFDNPEALECWAKAGSYSTVPSCPKITEGRYKSCDACSYFKKSLAHEIEVAGSIFNNLISTFSDLVTDSQRHAGRVTTIADAISAGAGKLNEQTQSQAAAVQQIAAGMEEMSASVGANVEGAKKAEVASRQGHNLAQKGAEAVEMAMVATRSVTARSKDITAIVDTVKEIAFRTNLLALNASVEAARAGEAGRGFAVVAGEVRSLAQQAQESAVRIKKLLSELVSGIHESDKRILEAGQALAVIVKGAETSTHQSAAISLSSQEQARAIENLNQVSVEIDRAAQGNAALVGQASRAAGTLAQSAHLVMETVGLFITEEKQTPQIIRKDRSGPLLIGPDGVDKNRDPVKLPYRR